MARPEDIMMRDIDWIVLMPRLGPTAYKLRKMCEVPDGPVQPLKCGAWSELTLAQVRAFSPDQLLRHEGIGPACCKALDIVDQLVAGDRVITRRNASTSAA